MNKKIRISVVLLIIAAVGFIGYIQIFGLSFEGKESDFYVPAVTGEANILAYKNSCTELNLSQVSKDPYSLIDKNVKVTGEIIEKKEYVQFDKARTSIVLKIPGLSPDPYIFVNYSGTLTFTQGDMITVYGKYHYPGRTDAPPEIANKHLPVIRAAYIEKK
ncbi:MAG: hypothetical protein PQ975_01870 [Methanobacterium sp.]|jgi:cytochrome c-type biogenesis protein CcmE